MPSKTRELFGLDHPESIFLEQEDAFALAEEPYDYSDEEWLDDLSSDDGAGEDGPPEGNLLRGETDDGDAYRLSGTPATRHPRFVVPRWSRAMEFYGSYRKEIRICVCGDAGSGKSSLIRRFCTGVFDPRYGPLPHTEMAARHIILPGDVPCTVRLHTLTIPRTSNSSSSTHPDGPASPTIADQVPDADALLLVYDLTNPRSLDGAILQAFHVMRSAFLSWGRFATPILVAAKEDAAPREARWRREGIAAGEHAVASLRAQLLSASAASGAGVELAVRETAARALVLYGRGN